METLVHIHSGWRWVVLILLLAAIVVSFMGWRSKKECTKGDIKIFMFAMISYHLQWTMGLIMYFMSDRVVFNASTMSSSVNRFYAVEHILGMTIAMALITIGYSKAKKITESEKKYKKIFWFYFISLLVVLATIPWPFRALGANWF